jgi:hypothetical protein
LDTIIVLFRLIVAIPLLVVIRLLWVASWCVWVIGETAIVLIAFPFAVLILSRKSLQESWVGQYPNFVRIFFRPEPVENFWESVQPQFGGWVQPWHATRLLVRQIWEWAVDPGVGADLDNL